MTAIETRSDTEILEDILNEESLPCSYEDCPEEASHILQCAVCGIGKETLCQWHKDAILDAPEWATIYFNKTCGHYPLVFECKILPI